MNTKCSDIILIPELSNNTWLAKKIKSSYKQNNSGSFEEQS